MKASESFVIGVDFGTDSVRAMILDSGNGEEVSSSVFHYPRWRDGLFCDPVKNQFRQHPLDYLEGLESAIKGSLHKAGITVAKNVKGISIDTTGSTPVAVNQSGTPLSLLPEFSNNPNAMFVLWKDHTSTKEAFEINLHASRFHTNYLKYVGGIYSSEWFWAKLLHILRVDTDVRTACYSWVEHCDWIPFLLTGGTDVMGMKRGVCAAGHKALWSAEFGGLPPREFFDSLDPLLNRITSHLFEKTYTSDLPAGFLSPEWAERLGLSQEVVVGIGAFDAHMGAVGGQIEPYYLSKVMGTSTCDMMVVPHEQLGDTLVKGICGQVPGSVIPGMIGMEAGQSAFGDTYGWFGNLLSWPIEHVLESSNETESLLREVKDKVLISLTKEARDLPLREEDPLSLDWLNGRRTPDANQVLKAAISGISLGSDPPTLFRSLVEGTCFGAKAIVERFVDEGIEVKGLIGIGGVARKSPYIMQMLADVIQIPIKIHRSEQTCAAGAAMLAATAAGIYKKVEDAMAAMGQGFDQEYHPHIDRSQLYSKRYERYKRMGAFIEKETIA